jgi:hypothetical protein
MEDEKVKTGVDALIDFLKDKEKVSLKEISEAIKTPEATIQLWVDFLIEEQILGVEYKFTKPYVFLNKTQKELVLKKEEQLSISSIKKQFFEKARKDQIPEEKIKEIWEKKILESVEKQKEYFLREALHRDLDQGIQLFDIYKEKILSNAKHY